jgi:three-Cys-motif partner protein
LHPNETQFAELHLQTHHKLEVMRRMFGTYLSVIAQAGANGRIDASRIYIVDGFAGAGSHLSAESPRHQIPGTAIEACIHARNVQRTFPGTRVSVRLIDIEPQVCARLGVRTAEYRDENLKHPDLVDVRILDQDFASQIAPILDETQKPGGGRYCSLWWIDPYGTKTIPKSALMPLLAGRGPEIVINLDVRGLKRQREAVYSPNTPPKTQATQRVTLNAIFGDCFWDIGADAAAKMSDDEQMYDLAVKYTEAVGAAFKVRQSYRLRSSDGQVRYLIHLTNSTAGHRAFEKSYNATMPRAKRTAMSPAERDKMTERLHARFKGTEATREQMLAVPGGPENGTQLNTVVRHAEMTGFGAYDARAGKMRWDVECSKPIALPLDFGDHTEKRRKGRVAQIISQPSLFDTFPTSK